MSRPVVELYGKHGCCLCDEALDRLRPLASELAFDLVQRDITSQERWHDAYFERIPVIVVDGEELCDFHLDEQLLRARLRR